MAVVSFSVSVPMDQSAPRVWAALVDWEAHGDWIPATRSRIQEGNGGLGTVFEAVSGYGPLALVDRMRVIVFDETALRAEVEKIGPLLGGTAGFVVQPRDGGCTVHWDEDVTVPGLPRILSSVAAFIGARAFTWSLRRMQRHL